MKNKSWKYCIVLMLVIGIALSCRKLNDGSSTTQFSVVPDSVTILKSPFPGQVPYPVDFTINCTNGPDYGDSIIYVQDNNKNDYIVKPVNSPGTGKYYSWPLGLVLDSLTGAINVSQSEQGARYMIGFVKSGTTDTCMQQLILSGVSYVDSVYSLSNNDTLAYPYYNADVLAAAYCDPSGEGDYPENGGNGNDKCQFDGIGKNGKIHQANDVKIKVRSISGIINLKNTLASGAFGPNPYNGQVVKGVLAYQLNNQSKKAIQEMELRLVYYSSRSAIPAEILDYIATKRSNILVNAIIGKYGHTRPPLIILVQ